MRVKYAILIEMSDCRIAIAGMYTLCNITFERDDASTTYSLNV